jgi:methionine aminopeptidase
LILSQNPTKNTVPIRTAKEIEGIRAACLLARRALDAAHAAVRPGVTTDEIDRIVHEVIVEGGGYPSPLNYYNFPKSVCTSVNEVGGWGLSFLLGGARPRLLLPCPRLKPLSRTTPLPRRQQQQVICHGIPDARELQDGDIVNVDVTAYLGGYHGDLNETFTVGNVDEAGRTLVRAAHDALAKAIEAVRPGVRFRDIGDIISKHVHVHGLSVVKTYCGHGIGDLFHCAPSIPHYTHNKAVGVMKEGQVRGYFFRSGGARQKRAGAGGGRAKNQGPPPIARSFSFSPRPRPPASGYAYRPWQSLHSRFLHPRCLLPISSPQNALPPAASRQVFTIEPMINAGSWRDVTWPDGWTAVTSDGKRSAQFEHQIVVTSTGCDVLTARLPTSPALWWEEK